MANTFVFEPTEWTEVPTYEGFYINKNGELLKKPTEKHERNIHGKFSFYTKYKIYKPYPKAEYLQFNIVVNGESTTLKQHRALALAFIPNPNNHTQVNHINGDKHNNNLSNLEWVTPSENVLHSYRIGLASNKGERHPLSLLKDQDVREIRELLSDKKLKQHQIGALYGVKHDTISRIKTGSHWSHVK